ncbi:F-box/LRR-repeat protein [Cardamine amara subsp. amara]|uniref:F-box/LRR-repeat protein n=1 Tax=Cardamine amara subsp. amara TaxID=228776 RepID=A0ABD0ZVW4_CARAN
MPSSNTLLALDLHTEEFRDVPIPPSPAPPRQGQIVNLEDRLTLATVYDMRYNWVLDIWSMDPQDETWSNTYTIPLFSRVMEPLIFRLWCRPVAVSKRGNLYFYDNEKRLFKYYPEANLVSCICLDTRVLYPFVENLLPLPRPDSAPKIRTFGFRYLDHVPGSWNSNFFRLIQLRNPNILLTTTVAAAALVIFRYYTVFSRF